MIYFLKVSTLNLPRTTQAVGILLILVVGLIHLYLAPMHFEAATYIGAAFAINFVASLVAALGIWLGAKNWGWMLGAYVASGALVAYVVTRALGLAGFEEAVGNWANPWGTFAMIVEGLYLVGYFSVAAGVAVATPERRNWHD